jgi:hypothetical protein
VIAFLEGDATLEIGGAVMLADNRDAVAEIQAEPTPLDRVAMMRKAIGSLPYTYNAVMAFALAVGQEADECEALPQFQPLVEALTACARLAAEIEADLV